MGAKHGWLFPMMVLAASSAIAFGCIGIAAIMGYLPLSGPIASPPESNREVARAIAQAQVVTVPAPRDVGTSPAAAVVDTARSKGHQ